MESGEIPERTRRCKREMGVRNHCENGKVIRRVDS